MTKSVQTLERAFDIIEILGNADYHLGISEIAQQSELPLSTTHRILTTLLKLGYVEQNPETSKYTLGVRILQLRGAVIGKLNLAIVAMPIMKMLMNRVEETVHLAVYNEGEIIYIERVEGLKTQGMYTRIGKRAPVHCTALGKVLLSNLPESLWFDEVVNKRGLKIYSETTISSVEGLRLELQRTRDRGYAIDNGETGEKVRCVAAPIRDYTGQTVAAISISGPQTQVTWERIKILGEAVCHAAELISEKLGFVLNW